MTVRVKVVETHQEIDELFRLRHRVFVEQDGYVPATGDGRMRDQFDDLPTVTHFAASVNGTIAGCLRYGDLSPEGTSVDEYFDFGPYLPPPPGRSCAGSMVAVSREFRGTPRLTSGLFAVFFLWAHLRGMTHIYGVANPERLNGFCRNGFRALGPVRFDERHRLSFVPIMLDILDLPRVYRTFLQHHAPHPLALGSLRQLNVAGETIVSGPLDVHERYAIVHGRAGLRLPSETSCAPGCPEIGPGQTFGSLASRTIDGNLADVIALSDVDLVVDLTNSRVMHRRTMP